MTAGCDRAADQITLYGREDGWLADLRVAGLLIRSQQTASCYTINDTDTTDWRDNAHPGTRSGANQLKTAAHPSDAGYRSRLNRTTRTQLTRHTHSAGMQVGVPTVPRRTTETDRNGRNIDPTIK